jgi:hypothetical protein
MKKKIMNVRNSKGKRRDSIYSKKILEYKRSTTGVEWSIAGVGAEKSRVSVKQDWSRVK